MTNPRRCSLKLIFFTNWIITDCWTIINCKTHTRFANQIKKSRKEFFNSTHYWAALYNVIYSFIQHRHVFTTTILRTHDRMDRIIKFPFLNTRLKIKWTILSQTILIFLKKIFLLIFRHLIKMWIGLSKNFRNFFIT